MINAKNDMEIYGTKKEKDGKIIAINNINDVLIEIGKTYYYYSVGLGEVKSHYVKRIENGGIWAVDSDGRVEIDNLYLTKEDVLNK